MNRVFSNIYIIDSSGLWLTSDSSDSGSFFQKNISAVNFVFNGSGEFVITAQSNTVSNVVLRIIKDGAISDTQSQRYSVPYHINERLFVRTVQNGTGFLYLS